MNDSPNKTGEACKKGRWAQPQVGVLVAMTFPFLAPAVTQALHLGVMFVKELQRYLQSQWKMWAV